MKRLRLRLRPGALQSQAAAYIFGLATAALAMALTLIPNIRQTMILRAFLIGVLCGAGALALIVIVLLVCSFEGEADDYLFNRTQPRRCSVKGCLNEVRRPETGQCEYHNGWITPESREQYYKRCPRP